MKVFFRVVSFEDEEKDYQKIKMKDVKVKHLTNRDEQRKENEEGLKLKGITYDGIEGELS